MKKKGFTLVELLVVIAILAILATVSIVGYTQFIAKAKANVCLQEATQVRNMLIADDINNKQYYIKDNKLYKGETGTTLLTSNEWATICGSTTDLYKDLGELASKITVDTGVVTYTAANGYKCTINFTADISDPTTTN